MLFPYKKKKEYFKLILLKYFFKHALCSKYTYIYVLVVYL